MPATEKPVFVCAHGAGGHKDARSMLALAAALPGFEVVRFNFPYRDRGSRRIDPMPVLKSRVKEIAEKYSGKGKLLLGGRSMGGRVATMLAADGFACDGLMLSPIRCTPRAVLTSCAPTTCRGLRRRCCA